jgi:hypothetical protein
MMLHHLEDGAGIDCPARRSHHEAVDGGEPHRRRNAAAVLHRADTYAVVQVRKSDPAARDLRSDFLKARRKKLIGEPMKPVPTNVLFGETARQTTRAFV